MNFLVIVQDLRVSGTSEGVVSRSFIAKLKRCFPHSVIDVVYLRHNERDDQLDLLPIDHLQVHLMNRKVPFHVKFVNRFYWRIFKRSLNEQYIINQYARVIKEIKYDKYDHIFIRSSGLEYETILGASDLPILKKAIINFHDAYPVFWDTGSTKPIHDLELYRFWKMWKVVNRAKICITPSRLLSEDMEFLYGSNKKFYTLPHQFDECVFAFENSEEIREKQKPVTISYHGAIQFSRNMDVLLDAYIELLNEEPNYIDKTEFVIRARGNKSHQLIEKYKRHKNIFFYKTLNFAQSAFEQKKETDIVVVLENDSPHSNILVGKAPFLAYLKKPLLSLSPVRSEMRRILKDDKYLASYDDFLDVKLKLKSLINEGLNEPKEHEPFECYFSDENFKKKLEKIFGLEKM